MLLIHIIVLALVQGVTEFLPISSSAHLVLVPALTGWEDQGLLIDVAMHVGTLLAVLLYFWRDVWSMTAGVARLLIGRANAEAGLVGKLAIATVPVLGAGYLLHEYGMEFLRSPTIIAWATIGFGVLLFVADKVGMTVRRIEHLGVAQALLIGVFQAIALIPGTSRSGITMTAARFLGFERPDAARVSFLMSIPVILAAGGLSGYDLYLLNDVRLTEQAITAGGLAFISALAAIALMMAWLKRMTFTPFVLYRIVLGGALLVWIYVYDGAPLAPVLTGQ